MYSLPLPPPIFLAGATSEQCIHKVKILRKFETARVMLKTQPYETGTERFHRQMEITFVNEESI